MRISTPPPRVRSRFGYAGAALFLSILPVVASAAIIDQTVASTNSSTAWNAALWGTPAAASTAGNTYRVVTGTISSSDTALLSSAGLTVTGRVRAYSASATFAGDSLEVLAGTELLLKGPSALSANIVLNGGVLRYSPDTSGALTLNGTLSVTANSYVGVVQGLSSPLTINSTLTGGNTLRLLSGGSANTIGFGGDLSSFTGTFDIGGGANTVTVQFNQTYDLSGASVFMRSANSKLSLSSNVTVGSFSFSGSDLASGTYTISQLNSLYGTGSQFAGIGSLTIAAIPEPSTVGTLFGVFAALAAAGRTCSRRRSS